MKKLFSIVIALSFSFSLYAVAIETSAITESSDEKEYCPIGKICVATNMTAKGFGHASGKDISGISVYKIDGKPVAYVPGHGNLSLYWSSGGETGWHFDANGGTYVIQNLGRDI